MINGGELRELLPVKLPLAICGQIAAYAKADFARTMRETTEEVRYKMSTIQYNARRAFEICKKAASQGQRRAQYMFPRQDGSFAVFQNHVLHELQGAGLLVDILWVGENVLLTMRW